MKAFVVSVSTFLHLFACCAGLTATFDLRNLAGRIGFDSPVFDSGGALLENTNCVAELYGGLDPGALSPARDAMNKRVLAPFRLPGYFSAGVVLIGTTPGPGPFWLQVRAWDRGLGATWEETAARGLGGYGESPMFYALGGYDDLHGVPPAFLIGLRSFRLRPATGVLMRSIRLEGDQVVVEWNPGFARYRVQQTSAVDQPWQDVGEPTTATSVTNTIGGTTRFIRVIGLLE